MKTRKNARLIDTPPPKKYERTTLSITFFIVGMEPFDIIFKGASQMTLREALGSLDEEDKKFFPEEESYLYVGDIEIGLETVLADRVVIDVFPYKRDIQVEREIVKKYSTCMDSLHSSFMDRGLKCNEHAIKDLTEEDEFFDTPYYCRLDELNFIPWNYSYVKN